MPPADDRAALRAACEDGVGLCTIVGIDGSFSRRLGAQLAVHPGGAITGSLADGCLETQLASEVAMAIGPVVRRFGAGSELIDFRLPCGSGLDVLIDPAPDRAACRAAVERLTAPGAQKLTVHSSRNGGTYVFGRARQDFAISVCKAAAPSAGAAVLDQLKATVSGGTLSASGPRSDGWVVYFIIDAPAKGDIDVDATNGPIHLAQLAGTTNVLAQNGPIELLGVSGRVTARTRNGPIAYDGSGGSFDGPAVLVTAVEPDSPAAARGLRANDIVYAVNRVRVRSVQQLREVAGQQRLLILSIRRGGRDLLLQIR